MLPCELRDSEHVVHGVQADAFVDGVAGAEHDVVSVLLDLLVQGGEGDGGWGWDVLCLHELGGSDGPDVVVLVQHGWFCFVWFGLWFYCGGFTAEF